VSHPFLSFIGLVKYKAFSFRVQYQWSSSTGCYAPYAWWGDLSPSCVLLSSDWQGSNEEDHLHTLAARELAVAFLSFSSGLSVLRVGAVQRPAADSGDFHQTKKMLLLK